MGFIERAGATALADGLIGWVQIGRWILPAHNCEIGFKEMDRLRERALGRIPTHLEVRRAVMPLLRHLACEIGWRIRGKLGGHR